MGTAKNKTVQQLLKEYEFLKSDEFPSFGGWGTIAWERMMEILFELRRMGYTESPDKPKAGKSTKRRPLSLSLRFRILERDGSKCVKCGIGSAGAVLEIDHIIPVSKGGLTEEANLQTLCFECNRGKRDK